MSKAFTRESDDAPEPRPQPRLGSPLPPGTKNYVTAAGAKRFQDELNSLVETERPKIAALPESDETRQKLRALDQRILQLSQISQTAVITPPPEKPWEQVRFGATVTVRNSQGESETYRIVGVDETDIDRNWVSWLSPIAKALLNARVGQRVRFKFPSGEEQLEIVSIAYE
jgi:transcription elongation factor GreB